MRNILLALTLFLVGCGGVETKSDVMVVVHRGDWRNFSENSLEAVESAIEMGADMVEIDLAMTKDSVLILLHDRTLDRTTSAKGRPSDYTLAEIKEMRLRNGQLRVTQSYTIPTLEEVMQLTRGRIKVNLDKADKYFDKVYPILEETNTLDDVVIKSGKPYEELRASVGENLDKMEFMPIVKITKETTLEEIKPLLDKRYSMYEIVFSEVNEPLMIAIKEELSGSDSKIWINSLWPSLCGGYSDNKAVATNPDQVWGYLIETLGAGVIQTDRPKELIEYLQSKNLHK